MLGKHIILIATIFLFATGKALSVEGYTITGKCKSRPFCELSGGIYLNAIYSGNRDLIMKLDNNAIREIDEFAKKTARNFGIGSNEVLFKFLNGISKKSTVLLNMVANKYLHDYQYWPSSCLKPGHEVKRYWRQDPTVIETDQWGGTSRTEGTSYEAYYKNNSNFFPLRDKIATYRGARKSTDPIPIKSQYLIYKGIEEMRTKYDCDSKEIKQFEKNLIKLTLHKPRSQTRSYSSRIVTKFMVENAKKPSVVTTPSGLQYIMIKEGKGAHPRRGEVVSIYYKGALPDGTVISKRYANGKPATLSIDKYTKGMTEGISLLRPGGKIKIFIPPGLGYGSSANGVINKDSVLIYEIELLQ